MGYNQKIFIGKLDRFIRKYYQNQLLRGCLLSLVFVLTYFLLISYSEYLFYLSVELRTFLAVFSVLFVAVVVVRLIVLPIVGLLKIGKRISYRQAILIITKYFPDIQDKLINTFELTELSNQNAGECNSLLMASINQRIEAIRLIPFRKAISYQSNFKYLKYILPVFAVFTATYFLIPDLYSSSTTRLVHFRQKYTPPAKFSFVVSHDNMQVEKGSDFLLKVATEGKYIPADVHVVYGGNQFLLKKDGRGGFNYLFRNVNSNITFYLKAGNVVSETYLLELLARPGIRTFTLSVKAPKYTNILERVEENLGDISVQEGAVLTWNIEGEDTNNVELSFTDSITKLESGKKGNEFTFKKRILRECSYKILLCNQDYSKELFANYSIAVIPDEFPQIQVEAIQDSLIHTAYYYKGVIKDDYGFSKLRFCYVLDGQIPVYIPIGYRKAVNTQEFYFAFDFSTVNCEEGSQIQYFFEVFDNDEINKPKMARSSQWSFYVPNSEQVYDLNVAMQDSISNQIEKGIELSQSIQKDITRLQKKLLDGGGEKWQQQEFFEEIKTKKRDLDKLLEEIQNENRKKNQLFDGNGLQDSLLMEKRKQIDQLLNDVMDDELQKLFEEFNKLAEDFKSEDVNKLGNKMRMSFEDFQKQMDRNLKLLEKYDIEVRMNKIIDRIGKIAENQEQISTKANKRDKKLNSQQVKEREKWEDLKNDLDELQKKNVRISNPYHFDDSSDELEEISDLMKESENLLGDEKYGKASKNMKATARKQKALAKRLGEYLDKSIGAQLTVDIDNLIGLMNNLMDFSFQQENIIADFRKVDYRNPLFVKMNEEQSKLKEQYSLIQDSLLALSSRSPEVASLIGNRVFDISQYLDQALEQLNNRRKVQANITQQKVLTEVNELTLFISEALKQLMEQMANAMPGDQIGDKKGGKPSFSGMQSEQQSIKWMLEQIIQEMKSGDGKPVSKERLGKFLQRQELFQYKLEEIRKEEGIGDETHKILREITKMIDETVKDISNFSINSNTVIRQNRIISRLLQAENAQREKDIDEKRESISGNRLKLSNPSEIFEYKRVRADFEGVFNDSYVKMFDYYNKLYLDYMIKINND